jgi:hypothetical protein
MINGAELPAVICLMPIIILPLKSVVGVMLNVPVVVAVGARHSIDL